MRYLNKYVSHSKSIFILGIATLGLLMAANPAKAFTLTSLVSQDADTDFDDHDFNAMLDSNQFKELFVAEGRIGNNSTNTAERELGINRDVRDPDPNLAGKPVAQDQFVWGNGTLYDLVLEYTGTHVNYVVGGKTLTSTAFSGSVTDIFFRTRAANNSTMTLSNFAIQSLDPNGNLLGNIFNIGGLSSTGQGSSDIDYLRLSNISTPFRLTGKVSMSWTGAAPSRSNLAYQIKVGTSPQSVPEPATVGAIFLAGIAGVGCSKRNRLNKSNIVSL